MARSEQQVIRDLQDEMVRRAEQIVRELNLKKGEGADRGKNQASKALEVAQSAGSLSVFINWLRYQAGRKGSSADFWTKSCGKNKRYLAKRMSDELVWLRKQVFEQVKQLAHNQQTESQQETLAQKQARVTMRAVIRFLGYFRRALIGADYLDDITLNKEAK